MQKFARFLNMILDLFVITSDGLYMGNEGLAHVNLTEVYGS